MSEVIRLSGLQPIIRRKLSEEVLDRLLARIQAGEFEVGSALPSERELMETYAVGRPPAREALQALERMGFVVIAHGERARLRPLSADAVIAQISHAATHLISSSDQVLDHLKQARLAFELSMARIAATQATTEDIDKLSRALADHRAALADPIKFVETDMAFHKAIATVSGNVIYIATSQAMLGWLQKFHRNLLTDPGAELAVYEEHAELLRRIAAQDVEGAVEVVRKHIFRASPRYQRSAQ